VKAEYPSLLVSRTRGCAAKARTKEKKTTFGFNGLLKPCLVGYFGTVPGSILSSIGRGYTDLCAALLAVGLDAEELQVWKEVDGIFTADPRKVPTARLIPIITPEEAAELTYYGSEVRTIQLSYFTCLG
jgi:aspartate kinase